jgi:hypothetical protein
MSWEMPRRSALQAAGAAVGAGFALSACARDEGSDVTELDSDTTVARAPQRNPLKGKVLFHDTFDDGFNGWRDHYGGFAPCPALSLTAYPVFSGSHALMIGCSAPPDAGYTNGWSGSYNAAAIKNVSRFYDDGLVTFSCYLAHGTDPSTASLGGYMLMFDTQAWSDNKRSMFQLTVSRNPGTGNRALSITDDNGKPIYVPGVGPSSFAGDNQNKFNFDWMSLTVDLSANRGLGGYHSCQINNRVFDLTQLGGGHANAAPQAGSAMESFAGGLNFTVVVWPGPPGSGESFVVVDQAIATVAEKI